MPEDEDCCTFTQYFRPEGEFSGTPRQEQLFIEKEGVIAHRQVLALLRPGEPLKAKGERNDQTT